MAPRKRLFDLRSYDAYAKPLQDFRIKTIAGAGISLISTAVIILLVLTELYDWTIIDKQASLTVDTGRKEKMKIFVDVIFPKAPCFLVSLDVMDVSGEHQSNVDSLMHKTRLDSSGKVIEKIVSEINKKKSASNSTDECGSCYGSIRGCCNTCEDVKNAYQQVQWSFDAKTVEQCIKEGVTARLKEQAHEGCHIEGYAQVNKVQGNIHFAPGASFHHNGMHIHDLHDFRDEAHTWYLTFDAGISLIPSIV